MPQTDKEFLIRVKADIDKAVADMRKLSGEIGKTGKQSKSAAAGTRSMGMSLQSLSAAAGAYLSIATAIKALKMADEWNTLQQRIKTATKETGDYAAVSQELFEISQRNGAAMADTVATFQRLAIARTELKATNSEILKVTEAVQQLGRQSGASTSAMQAGMLQFAQAMGAGTVRAEELNSIIENMPAVAERIARGMGMTTAELRNAVLEGKVLSREVFDSLLGQSGDIAKEMAAVPLSMERSWTVALNSLGAFLGRLDELTGVTDFISNSLQDWAGFLDDSLKMESELERLQKKRAKILEQIKWTDTNTPGAEKDERLRFLRIENEMLEEQIALFEKSKQAKLAAEKTTGGATGSPSSTSAVASQKALATQIKNVNDLLKDQTRLFEQQAAAVEKAQDKIKSVQAGFDEARKQLEGGGQESKAPDIFSVSSDITKANSLADAGNYDEAIKAAEAARDAILEMGQAGAESELVLKGLLLQAEQAGVGAAKSIEENQQAEIDKTQAVITDLMAKAEQLKALKVGFDTAGALTEAALLRASLEEEFEKNPLKIPVTVTKLGDALPGGNVSASRFDNVPAITGKAQLSATQPGKDNVVKYKMEIDTSEIDNAIDTAAKQAQAAADAQGPVIIKTEIDGVTTFSDGTGSFEEELRDEVLMRGSK